MLLRLLERQSGPLSAPQRRLLEEADPETLLAWSEQLLTADRGEEVLTH